MIGCKQRNEEHNLDQMFKKTTVNLNLNCSYLTLS